MEHALTAAGIKLCMMLGIVTPTYDICEKAIQHISLPTDMFMHDGPSQNWSSPDDNWKAPKGYSCTKWGTYKIMDGSSGSDWFCTRPAIVRWIPETAIWEWDTETLVEGENK